MNDTVTSVHKHATEHLADQADVGNSHYGRSAGRKPAEAGTPTPNRPFSGLLVFRLQAVCGHNANC